MSTGEIVCSPSEPRSYLHRSLGWDQTKADSILLPLIKREKERKEGTLKSQRMVTDLCVLRDLKSDAC